MQVQGRSICFDSGFVVEFNQTYRLPEDGKIHALPPSLGKFPIKRVEDYAGKVPQSWLKHGGVFIPMFQREAMWMTFRAEKPVAVKIAAGKVNAVNGKMWSNELCGPTKDECSCQKTAEADPKQDYMICGTPKNSQPWLDGFNAGDGFIKQFVAMPLGKGYTVEAQVTGKEDVGGIQILTAPAKPGAIPQPEYRKRGGLESCFSFSSMDSNDGGLECLSAAPAGAMRSMSATKGAEMGLGGGGKMKQSVYADAYGVDSWDQSEIERVFVHIVNSDMYYQITGEYPPASPVTRDYYTRHGLVWTNLYDEGVEKVEASGTLAKVKTIGEIDQTKGVHQFCGTPAVYHEHIVHTVKHPNAVTDGNW